MGRALTYYLDYQGIKINYTHKKFYSKGIEGRELKLVSSISAFVN